MMMEFDDGLRGCRSCSTGEEWNQWLERDDALRCDDISMDNHAGGFPPRASVRMEIEVLQGRSWAKLLAASAQPLMIDEWKWQANSSARASSSNFGYGETPRQYDRSSLPLRIQQMSNQTPTKP